MTGAEIIYDIPVSRDSIVASLAQADRGLRALWARIASDEFFTYPPEDGWSPAGNVVHLIGAVRPVTLALRLPRFLPRLLFGRPGRPSRSFVEMRETYLAILRGGGSAGRYAPRRRRPPADTRAARAKLCARWDLMIPALCAAVDRWEDAQLDEYLLPHPLLGKLTVREMLFFSLYHLGHHGQVVAARFPRSC